MEYVYLGDSGLEVSRLGMGAIPFGTSMERDTYMQLADIFLDHGGNLIDTSNFYGGGMIGDHTNNAGKSERAVGEIIKGRRDRFVVATKGYWTMEEEIRPNGVGLSRAYLSKNIDESLKRLGTDYIDLYQCHNKDFYTPIEETMRVFDDFIRAGKIRYIGVSNWDGWHVVKANMYAREKGLTPFVSNQIWYNIADRVAEFSLIPACQDQGVATIGWGVVAEGFVCGKYDRSMMNAPEGKRIFEVAKQGEMFSWERLATDRNWDTIDVIREIAEKHNRTMANVAVRWILDAGFCEVALLGASRVEQFENNMEVMDFKLTDEEIRRLTETSELPHPYPINFYDIFCRKDSEFYGGLR